MQIQIGDNIYTLEFHVNSVCALEDLTGKELGEITALPEYTGMRWLLWCALAANHRALTPRDVGDLMEVYLKTHSKANLMSAIGAAVDASGFLVAQGMTTSSPT